jgi:K+-transporting ATPase KdpF subunit
MTALQIVGAVVAGFLLLYLIVALLEPERFS